jgi:hypothetical protein
VRSALRAPTPNTQKHHAQQQLMSSVLRVPTSSPCMQNLRQTVLGNAKRRHIPVSPVQSFTNIRNTSIAELPLDFSDSQVSFANEAQERDMFGLRNWEWAGISLFIRAGKDVVLTVFVRVCVCRRLCARARERIWSVRAMHRCMDM